MYEAIEIAGYVINKSIEINDPVTNIKLQKLLYYIQKEFLKEKGRVCFEESLVNWRHGAVVEEVYKIYKVYQDEPIRNNKKTYRGLKAGELFQFSYVEKPFDDELIADRDKEIIDRVIRKYQGIDTWEMVKQIKEEKEVRNTKHGEEIDLVYRDKKKGR